MEKFYFTFGYGHWDANDFPLDDHYTIVEGNYGEARERMVEIWGVVWAFQYSEEQFLASPHLTKLTYVPCPKSKLYEQE